ncbi:MAG: hypothetical protein K2X47_13560 [Bdellovibrionales bacterium]|nr:hypothetical protein [Bdellovibrionales bacterium]
MLKRMKYGSYSPWVKAAIASSGKVDLFPDLNIPRTTAKHWIAQGFAIGDQTDSNSSAMMALLEDLANTKQELLASRAIIKLLKSVFETMGFKLRWKHIDSTKTRENILEAIATAMIETHLNVCLQHLDLSLSRYKRWTKPPSRRGEKKKQNKKSFA